jgi:phosphoglycolate phosphatase-like HAD superfamily hydrolase
VKLLLFDIDQTLISTGGAGIRALNRAFQKVFSIHNAMDGILPHGKTDPGIVREIFLGQKLNISADGHPASLTSILDSYLEFLANEIDQTSAYEILPGILDILTVLGQRPDISIGLATGNVEKGARIKLARGNLNQYFAFGVFGSDAEDRTQLVRHAAELGIQRSLARWGRAPEPDAVFVIGDTPRDIEAGRQAGFLTVGVATGKYSRSELIEAGATVAIANFADDCDQFLRVTRIE